MWQLVDFNYKYIDNGCDVQDEEEVYTLKNLEDGGIKNVDELTYNKMKKLGLIAERKKY
jgi:hypothetical protein